MSFVREIHLDKKTKLNAEARKKASEMIENARKEDSKLVKGMFKNLEVKGGDANFPYRKYRGEPLRLYNFQDGETYEIPLGLAKHINNNCKRKRRTHVLDINGRRTEAPGKHEQRYEFVSTDFS